MPVAALNFQQLEAALEELGPAVALIGDPFTANGLAILGLIEGDVTPNFNPAFAYRSYSRTGPAKHRGKLLGFDPSVELPLIKGDPTEYAKVSPTGTAAGGHDSAQDLTETALVLVPEAEFADGFEVTTGAWVKPTGGPSHAIWFWNGHFLTPSLVFGDYDTDAGKRVANVTYQAMRSSSENTPDGVRMFCIGDPLSQGVTNLAI